MKKNRMMRLASGLLVLCLLTVCAVGGTFAKYTTGGSAADTARVAKFGVTVTASGSLFSNAYVKATGNTPAAAWSTSLSDNITVATATNGTENLVAPGTQNAGDGLSFAITGQPEVAVRVTAVIEAQDIYLAVGSYATISEATGVTAETYANYYVLDSGAYKKATSYSADTTYYTVTEVAAVADSAYKPVQYAYGDSDQVHSATDLALTIAKEFAASTSANDTATYEVSKDFDANTDLSSGNGIGISQITWKWKFEDYDPQDTLLGNLIAERAAGTTSAYYYSADGGTYTALTLSNSDYTVNAGETTVANLMTALDLSITVDQID